MTKYLKKETAEALHAVNKRLSKEKDAALLQNDELRVLLDKVGMDAAGKAGTLMGAEAEVKELKRLVDEKRCALKQCEDENSDFMKKVARLTLALEEIAALPPSGDGGMMRAQNIADEAVHLNKAEKRKCDESHTISSPGDSICRSCGERKSPPPNFCL